MGVGMHAHPAKIVAEARFERGAGGRIKRLARRTQHLVHNRRGNGGRRLCTEALKPFALTTFAFTATCRVGAACAGALEQWPLCSLFALRRLVCVVCSVHDVS
jgi:hypothetical protein